MTQDCIFCKIANQKTPAKIALETTNVIAFYDKDPSADTHILVVPKKHISSFMDIGKEDNSIISHMLRVVQQIIKEKKIENKYKLVINGGERQFIPHLHLHILGGETNE